MSECLPILDYGDAQENVPVNGGVAATDAENKLSTSATGDTSDVVSSILGRPSLTHSHKPDRDPKVANETTVQASAPSVQAEAEPSERNSLPNEIKQSVAPDSAANFRMEAAEDVVKRQQAQYKIVERLLETDLASDAELYQLVCGSFNASDVDQRKGKYRIALSEHRVYEKTGPPLFCSAACVERAMSLRLWLSGDLPGPAETSAAAPPSTGGVAGAEVCPWGSTAAALGDGVQVMQGLVKERPAVPAVAPPASDRAEDAAKVLDGYLPKERKKPEVKTAWADAELPADEGRHSAKHSDSGRHVKFTSDVKEPASPVPAPRVPVSPSSPAVPASPVASFDFEVVVDDDDVEADGGDDASARMIGRLSLVDAVEEDGEMDALLREEERLLREDEAEEEERAQRREEEEEEEEERDDKEDADSMGSDDGLSDDNPSDAGSADGDGYGGDEDRLESKSRHHAQGDGFYKRPSKKDAPKMSSAGSLLMVLNAWSTPLTAAFLRMDNVNPEEIAYGVEMPGVAPNSEEIKKACASCLFHALPDIMRKLGMKTPVQTIEAQLRGLLGTFRFRSAIPYLGNDMWKLLSLMFLQVLSEFRLPAAAEPMQSETSQHMITKLLKKAGLSKQMYDACLDMLRNPIS
eukprot:gene5443-6598_t